MSDRLQVYATPEVTVTGVCVRGLPAVFDINRRRWIRPELASPEDVRAQVARCPSGALQIREEAP